MLIRSLRQGRICINIKAIGREVELDISKDDKTYKIKDLKELEALKELTERSLEIVYERKEALKRL